MADRNLRLQVILEGLDKLTSPLKNITGASSAARRDIAKTGEELKHLDGLQKQIGSYKAKEDRFGADTRNLRAAQARLAELRTQLDATEKPTKKLRSEFERTEKQAAALTTRIEAGGAELQQMARKLDAAGIDVADLASHEGRLAARTEEATRALRNQTTQLDRVNKAQRNAEKLNDVSSKATGMGLGMVAAGAAAGAPVVAAVKQAMTLESAMADVTKVTNMSADQTARLSNDFLDLSTHIPMAASELANIAAAAGAAGVGMDKFGKPLANQREQLLEFTNDAAEMGVAFDMTANEAGDTMAKWRTAFELPQVAVRALGDDVNALTNRFGGKASNVTDIITRIGPLGRVAGLAAPQIAALGSTLDSIGVAPEIAATGIKNMMLTLTSGANATKAQSKAFQALGLDATDVAKRMQVDAAGTITDVMKRFASLDQAARPGMLAELFGTESVGAIAPLLTNLDGLQQRLTVVGDASQTAGSMHQEFLNRIATTEGATGLASNALSGLNITMGQALLPTVVAVSEMVTGAANTMRAWAQEHPALAKAVMIFMGVGAGLLVLLGGVALAFAAVSAAAAPVVAVLGISLGALLGWVVAVIAAVAAVAAIAYLIYDNWGTITAFFAGIWESIVGFFTGGIGNLAAILVNFSPMGLLYAGFAALMNWLGVSMPSQLSDIGGHMMQGLINGITAKLGAIKSTVVNAASSIATWFKEKLGIHSPSRVFAGLGGFVMAGLDQGLADNTAGPLSRISALADGMAATMATPLPTLPPIVRVSRAFASGGSARGSGADDLIGGGADQGSGWSGMLDRMLSISGTMTKALAMGAATPAIAAPTTLSPPSEAAQGAPGRTAPAEAAGSRELHLHFHGVSGDPEAIAEAVRRAMEQYDRDQRGRRFSDN